MFVSIWQVQIPETIIWSSPSRYYVPKEDMRFSELPNVSVIADDILIYENDHNEAD